MGHCWTRSLEREETRLDMHQGAAPWWAQFPSPERTRSRPLHRRTQQNSSPVKKLCRELQIYHLPLIEIR